MHLAPRYSIVIYMLTRSTSLVPQVETWGARGHALKPATRRRRPSPLSSTLPKDRLVTVLLVLPTQMPLLRVCSWGCKSRTKLGRFPQFPDRVRDSSYLPLSFTLFLQIAILHPHHSRWKTKTYCPEAHPCPTPLAAHSWPGRLL